MRREIEELIEDYTNRIETLAMSLDGGFLFEKIKKGIDIVYNVC